MFLSRAKAVKNAAATSAAAAAAAGAASGDSSASASATTNSGQKIPELSHFIDQRDFLGAVTLLQFQKSHADEKTDVPKLLQWLGFSAFHLGDYTKALEV
jgi:intraflagellar transport protein 56